MYKKYFSEHSYYFIIFIIISSLYLFNGYASIETNDDWALRGMLTAKNIYGTLIMSYPLSYVVSHLYDFVPSFPWYSTLLTLVMALNFYLISLYIAKNDHFIQKIILLILSVLWMTFLWFNMSITILTVTTMISAIGFIHKNLLISFVFVFIASLLRIDIMLIFIPFYAVSYFILRNPLRLNKNEILGLVFLLFLVISSLIIQKQDKSYSDWLAFNKARAAIADMGILNVKKDFFTKTERFCINISWWQDTALLSSEKIIKTTPSLSSIIQKNIQNFYIVPFVKNYKFKEWLWILLAASLILILLNFRNRKALFIPLFIIGTILLLITRDVERVTVPLIMMWAYIVYESTRSHRILNITFISLFTYIFYSYIAGQLGYRYFNENTALLKEAHQLIKKSNKVCESSILYPTLISREVNAVFKANYLFHENNWLQLNDKEILPGGWLSRNKFFYISHNLSDAQTKRKYATYHDYLIDEKTAFFGSKQLRKSKSFQIFLLNTYDKLYLKDRPNCKHKIFIINESKHFSISQIRVDCNSSTKPK